MCFNNSYHVQELWNGIMQYGFLFGYEQRQFILPAPESKLPIHAAIWKLYPKFLTNGITKSKKHSEVVVEGNFMITETV